MGELFKKIIILVIGLWFVLYFSKIIFAQFNVSNSFKEIGNSLAEIRKLGQASSTANNFNQNSSTFSNPNGPSKTSSSAGAESAVSLGNLFRGNIVSPSTPINGLAPATWFYQGVATARFLDENGSELGVSQMVQQGDLNATGQVPFIVTPQFTQGYAKTGYVLFEKTNTTGDKTKDAWFTLPITYPLKEQPATTTWQGTSYNQSTQQNNTNTTNTLGSGSTIPNPTR